MAEHITNDVTIRPVIVTLQHKLDPDQFAAMLAILVQCFSSDDESRIPELTAQLKTANDNLAAVVAANQPPPTNP